MSSEAPQPVTSSDCLACRGCCTFDAKYPDYAPLFTTEQRDRVQTEFADVAHRAARDA